MRQLRRWCRRWTVSRASPQPGREHHQSQRGQGRFERALDVEHRWKYWRSRLSPAQASSPAVSRAIWERPDRKNRFCSTSTAKENGAGFGDLQHPCSYRCYRLNGGNEMVPEQKSNGTRRNGFSFFSPAASLKKTEKEEKRRSRRKQEKTRKDRRRWRQTPLDVLELWWAAVS